MDDAFAQVSPGTPGGKAGRSKRILAALLAFVPAACSDSGTEPVGGVPSRLSIITTGPAIAAGESMTLRAQVLDHAGTPIPGATITWSSEDPTTASVGTTTGLMEGVAGGEVRIVARSGTLTDDVVALVFYELAGADARVRFRAATESLWDLEGEARSFDRLGTTVGDYTAISLSDDLNFVFGNPTVTALVLLPGLPSAGEVDLPNSELLPLWEDESLPSYFDHFDPLVLILWGAYGLYTQYQSTGGWTDVVQVSQGLLRGRMMVSLTGFTIDLTSEESNVTPLGDSATLYADFSVRLHDEVRPNVQLEEGVLQSGRGCRCGTPPPPFRNDGLSWGLSLRRCRGLFRVLYVVVIGR